MPHRTMGKRGRKGLWGVARRTLPAAHTLMPGRPCPDSWPPLLPSLSLLVGQDGWTPLFFACLWGRVDNVKALIGKGANVSAKCQVRIAVAVGVVRSLRAY
jgi:hypothetical protein